MAGLTVTTTSAADFDRQWRTLREKLTLEAALLGEFGPQKDRLDSVRDILAAMRRGLANGAADNLLLDYLNEFDRVKLSDPGELRISDDALRESHERIKQNKELYAAIGNAIANVRSYQEAIKLKQVPDWTTDGLRLGIRYRPIRRVGICVPGASAPLVSTVVMTAVPAQVAGVTEIAVISAPRPDCDNSIHPAILGTCCELGITEVYRISGAHGVAALAFGTETIKKVDKIVGPSNWWGQLAKKEVYGLVDIDSFAGPSEVLILADDSARPAWVAADMLSQAEHSPGSGVLLTDSTPLAQAVAKEIESQLTKLSRGQDTRRCIEQFCLAVVTRDIDQAVDLANDFAAEHLQIQCRDSGIVAERITNAGAIFVGHYSPVATGDYYAGPSHTLPTGGSARFFSALNVNDFLNQSSIIAYDQSALDRAAGAITTIARAEGLDAHARSIEIRSNL